MFFVICAAAGLLAGMVVTLLFFAIQSRRVARRRRARTATADQPQKRRFEFSKLLAVWAALIATGALVASFLLAAYDKQPVSDLAIAVFTACIGYLITYAGKSAFEKNSRNKHGLDADGQPFDYEKE